MANETADIAKLLQWFQPFQRCAVALSGGVDSAVVAAAAQKTLGDRALAITGQSASLATGELETARQVAATIGIRHVVLATREFENPDYLRNHTDRCYHCKTELYDRMDEWLERFGVDVVLNGANADDLADYRPGMQAASEHRVRSPLAECELTKAQVRAFPVGWPTGRT
jgi:pyridinium-3,5-biscarboxylic acid mononucleotide sulfurtransferase